MSSLHVRSGDSWRNLSVGFLGEAESFLAQKERGSELPTAADVGFLRFFQRELGSYHNDDCAANFIKRSYFLRHLDQHFFQYSRQLNQRFFRLARQLFLKHY